MTPKSTDKASETPRAKIKRTIERRGLSGLANDTKWHEFKMGMLTLLEGRGFGEWPAYRFKSVDGQTFNWDVHWKYHLPPMIEVEWLDIAYRQEVRDQRLPPNITILDYGQDIVDLLQRIGLEFEVGKKHVRIFGYAPRRRELFDE